MSEPSVTTHVDSIGVATLTLNRPDLHNAFNEALIAALDEVLAELENDPQVLAVVLAGSGKSFSAGADLNWMRRTAEYTERRNREDARCFAEMMGRLDRLPKPTVARVQGPAYGGGVGLIACCDIAIASQTASFALSEVKLGLIPAVISPYVIRAMGQRQARRYFLTAERFDAAQAYRLGLIHQTVDPEALDHTLERLLETLLANGPDAMAAAKDLIATVGQAPLDAALRANTAERIAAVRAGAEAREGLSAFLGKRKPHWQRGH